MVVGSRKEQSLGRQGRVSAEATRSGSSRWARLLCAADAAAARAHAPGQAGPRERGGYAVRAIYALRATVSPRRVSEARRPGRVIG